MVTLLNPTSIYVYIYICMTKYMYIYSYISTHIYIPCSRIYAVAVRHKHPLPRS